MRRGTVMGLLNKVMPTVLALTGSMLVAIGIGMVYQPAGWMAAGLMAWLLEFRFYGGSEADR